MARGKRGTSTAEPSSPDVSAAVKAAVFGATLAPFEGREVLSCGVEVPSVAGGLRESVDVDPIEIHHGDQGVLVLRWRCKKVRFDGVKDTEGLRRVAVLDVLAAAFADDEFEKAGDEYLDTQAERIRHLRDLKTGQGNLADGLAGEGGFFDPGDAGYPDGDGSSEGGGDEPDD